MADSELSGHRARMNVHVPKYPSQTPISDSELESVIELGSPFMARMAAELRFWREEYRWKCGEADELRKLLAPSTVLAPVAEVQREAKQ